MRLPNGAGAEQFIHEAGKKGVLNQGGLAAAGNPGDANKEPERNRDIDALQVVPTRIVDGNPAIRHARRQYTFPRPPPRGAKRDEEGEGGGVPGRWAWIGF